MLIPETIRVVSENGPQGFVTMNLDQFDPNTMEAYVEPASAPGATAEGEDIKVPMPPTAGSTGTNRPPKPPKP